MSCVWRGLLGSRVKLSGFDSIVHGGAGSSDGVARCSSAARCAVAMSRISVGSVIIFPDSGCLIDVSFGEFFALGCSPAETFRP